MLGACPPRPRARRAPTAHVLHRLPHARQRDGGRGHRAGRVPAPARAIARGRADRAARGVRVDGRDATRDRRAALGARAPARSTRARGCPSRCPTTTPIRRIASSATRRSRSPSSPCSSGSVRSSGRCSSSARCSTSTTPTIAAIVERDEAACRQVMHRARARIADGRPRFDADAARDAALLDTFFAALDAGDVDALASVLADDVVFYADGGGKAPAVRHPLHGAVAVARFLAGLVRRGEGMHVHMDRIVGERRGGAAGQLPDGATLSLLMVHVGDGRVVGRRQPAEPRQAPPPRAGRRPERARDGRRRAETTLPPNASRRVPRRARARAGATRRRVRGGCARSSPRA